MSRVRDFSKNLYRGTKSLWKKYHFLVPPSVLWKKGKYLVSILTGLSPVVDPMNKKEYATWLKENVRVPEYKTLSYRPLISILIPVYNVKGKYLKECLSYKFRVLYSYFLYQLTEALLFSIITQHIV